MTSNANAMCSVAAAIRSGRASYCELGNGFSILLSMVAPVTLMSLAGCHVHGTINLAVETEGPSMTEQGGAANPDAKHQIPEEKTMENVVVEMETDRIRSLPRGAAERLSRPFIQKASFRGAITSTPAPRPG
jgi:hypothetical protein